LIPIFKKVTARLQMHYPDLFVLIPTVDAIAKEVEDAFADMQAPHCIIKGQHDRYQAFYACQFAIAASGTVTLELTACGAPHLIAYRFSRLTNLIVKLLITTKYANLINVLANHPVIPEFVLDNCREELIYAKALALMQNSVLAQEQVAQAEQYFSQLKPKKMLPSEKAASVVLETLTATSQV
jgi:lipid-A-disaccharide synthase